MPRQSMYDMYLSAFTIQMVPRSFPYPRSTASHSSGRKRLPAVIGACISSEVGSTVADCEAEVRNSLAAQPENVETAKQKRTEKNR